MAKRKKLPGYHIADIPKGDLGEISKIHEEALELKDADEQNCQIMVLVELSDLLGSIDHYLRKHHPSLSINDLQKMANITERAFKNGRRT